MTEMEQSHLPIVAAFDFDGTITYYDSLVPFLFFVFGFWKALGGLALQTPYFIEYLFGKKTRAQIKEIILTYFFRGMPLERMQKFGHQYGQGSLNKHVRQSALDRIKWHREQKHRLIIISASIDIYLKPWAELVGIDDVISSKLLLNEKGCITGKLLGENCRGPEKVKRLEGLLGNREGYILYAYGDSDGDKELLESADFPYFNKMKD
jgi:phosphatidylglycerophosphatase C